MVVRRQASAPPITLAAKALHRAPTRSLENSAGLAGRLVLLLLKNIIFLLTLFKVQRVIEWFCRCLC